MVSGIADMRTNRCGPWSSEAVLEDVCAAAEFEATGEAIPFDEIVAWMKSWGTATELPAPKPRRLLP
jgi:hypothetical protein